MTRTAMPSEKDFKVAKMKMLQQAVTQQEQRETFNKRQN